jgi:integrase
MNTPANLRFQISLLDGQPHVRAVESADTCKPAPRKDRKPLKIKGGVRIYPQTTRFASHGKRRKYQTHCIIWVDAAGRHRERRATRADAEARRDEILEAMESGKIAMLEFTEADRANWLAVKASCHRIGRQPVEFVAEAVAANEQLAALDQGYAGCGGLAAAAKFVQDNRPKRFAPMAVPALVEEFLAIKKIEITEGGYAINSYAALAVCLNRFAAHFDQVPIHLVASADLITWLRGLQDKNKKPLGARARHNHRAAADQVMRWAQANGRLPKTWDEIARVPDPGTKPGEIKILTPDQVLALITARQNSEQAGRARKKTMMPFLFLQLFAGVRHEEMCPTNPKKIPLDWKHVHLANRCIYIPKETAKTGIDRWVPITDNLAAWLEPYVRRGGRICDLDNVSVALTRAKKAAKIPFGKNETRNILRKTFISYRLPIVKHIGTVAEEAGNSPGIIRKHYRRIIPPGHLDSTIARPNREHSWHLEADAQRHFALRPELTGSLFAWARSKAPNHYPLV